MDHEKQYPNEPSGLAQWIIDDLDKSGLSVDYFGIDVLTSETELKDRLGFTHIGKESILEVGGYWISYPNVPGYCRLKLKEQIEGAKYLSPSKEKGFGVPPYILPEVHALLKTYSPDKPVFITEGEKKAAKMTLSGFPCIGIPGVWNWNEIERDLLPDQEGLLWKDRKAYVVFDSDIVEKYNVRHAELRFAIEHLNKGATVYSVRLPNEPDRQKNGADDYLVRYGTEAFKGLVEAAKPTLEVHVSEGTKRDLILRELPSLQDEIETVKVLKAVAKREGVSLDVVQTEYQKYLPSIDKSKEYPGETFTAEQIQEAGVLLKSPDILDQMIAFNRRLGFTGEEINQRLLYLSFTSRLMDSSISTVVKGQSATGKSYLTGTVIRLFPESDVMNFSFITGKALVHRQDNLSHKILYIAEHSGGEGAEYSVRTLLSEGEISIMLPVKNENTGHFETVEKRIPAKGLVFVETTTRDRIHYENQTRLFDLYVDESPEQTRRVLEAQATQVETDGPEVEDEVKAWRCAQTLLEPYRVHIPYARMLAKEFPTDKPRARRDYPKLLNLIRSHALLYQCQRKTDDKGRLVATVEDFEAILPLAETVLAQSMKDMSPKQESVLLTIEKEFQLDWFSVKVLAEKAGGIAAYRTLQGYCGHFAKEGILMWNGQKGAASRYRLSTPVAQLHNRGIFAPNLLETLLNDYVNPELHNVAQLHNGEENYADNAILCKNENCVIKSNDNRNLDPEKGDCADNASGAEIVCDSEGADETERLKERLNTIERDIRAGVSILNRERDSGRDLSHVEARVAEEQRERDQVLKKLSTTGSMFTTGTYTPA